MSDHTLITVCCAACYFFLSVTCYLCIGLLWAWLQVLCDDHVEYFSTQAAHADHRPSSCRGRSQYSIHAHVSVAALVVVVVSGDCGSCGSCRMSCSSSISGSSGHGSSRSESRRRRKVMTT